MTEMEVAGATWVIAPRPSLNIRCNSKWLPIRIIIHYLCYNVNTYRILVGELDGSTSYSNTSRHFIGGVLCWVWYIWYKITKVNYSNLWLTESNVKNVIN